MPDAGPLGTPHVTTFDCPAENPLYEGGNWAQTTPDRPPMQKVNLAGNCVATDSIHGDPNYSHWTTPVRIEPGQRGEVWGCIEGGQLGAALETWRVALWRHVGSHLDGYLVYNGGGIGKDIAIRRYNGGGISDFTLLGSVTTGYPEALALVIDDTHVQAWQFTGGAWVLSVDVVSTTFRGIFYGGIAIEDPTGGGLDFTCFGVGVPNRQQFFRWLYN